MKTELTAKQQKEIARMADADMAQIRNCKTPAEVTKVWAGRKVIIQDNGPFHNQMADFMEMTGDAKDRRTWQMKVKTQSHGNYLFLKGGEFIMLFKTIEV